MILLWFSLHPIETMTQSDYIIRSFNIKNICFPIFIIILFYFSIPVHGPLCSAFGWNTTIQVRNATAVFIINLSLSDLLFCCFNLPLAASTFWNRAWTHGDLLCRLYPLLRYGLLAVSLFTILAITINRYVMIGHPRIYPRFVVVLYGLLFLLSDGLCVWRYFQTLPVFRLFIVHISFVLV